MSKVNLLEGDVAQALIIIGIDINEDEARKLLMEARKSKTTIKKLEKFCEMAAMKEDIPKSSITLAKYYNLFLEYAYESKEKAADVEYAMSVIADASCISVLPENDTDYEKNFKRLNSVLTTLFHGFLYSDSVDEVREALEDSSDLESFFDNYAIPYYTCDSEKFNFYALLTLSKLGGTGKDHMIFDDNDEINHRRLFRVTFDALDDYSKPYIDFANHDTDKKQSKKQDEVEQKILLLRRLPFRATISERKDNK